MSSQTLPMFVNLFINFDPRHPETPGQRKFTLVTGFGGDPETVAWQSDQSREIMEQNDGKGVATIADEPQQRIQETIQEFSANNGNTESVIVKVNLKRTDIAEFSEHIIGANWTHNVQMMALLGNGVLYLTIPVVSETDFQALSDVLTALRQSALEVQGNLIIERAPPELKRYIDVWGPVGKTLHLMKQVKAKFDADGLLNPGRFIASI